MKIEINIPSNLSEVTLEQYQRYCEIEEPTDADLLSCFLNLSLDTINAIKYDHFKMLVFKIKTLLESEQDLITKFTLNGIKFGFIPKMDDITYGENNDITAYIGDVQTLHKAMAVLYRPINIERNKGYLIDDYNGTSQYSETMKKMPLDVVLGAMVFFYNLTKELLQIIPSYLEKVTREEMKTNTTLQENGVDIMKSIHSLKVTFEDMMKLQSYPSINV